MRPLISTSAERGEIRLFGQAPHMGIDNGRPLVSWASGPGRDALPANARDPPRVGFADGDGNGVSATNIITKTCPRSLRL